MSRTHDLKIWPEYFQPIIENKKTFEVRREDEGRSFSVDDVLRLQEYEPKTREQIARNKDGRYTGREALVRVTYVLRQSEFVRKNYVVMGFRVLCALDDGMPIAGPTTPEPMKLRIERLDERL